jgi:hypothetical protein
VRDEIRYDPYSSSMQREAMRASTAVIKGVGYCVPKALVYCRLPARHRHPGAARVSPT